MLAQVQLTFQVQLRVLVLAVQMPQADLLAGSSQVFCHMHNLQVHCL